MDDHICCEIQYGGIHSDLCGTDVRDPEWREVLHSALDEWLNNSNGDGCFYVGNVLDMVGEFLDEKKVVDNFLLDAQITLNAIQIATQNGDYEYAHDRIISLNRLSEKLLKMEVL